MDSVMIRLEFPAVATALGWAVPAENGPRDQRFRSRGRHSVLRRLARLSALSRRRHFESPRVWREIWGKVRRSALKSTISILALVAMASLMTHTGMTQMIARGISETFDADIYPLFAPFIGTLGAFMTGSNANSNVVFGALQQETATLLALERARHSRRADSWRLARQRSGAGQDHRRLQHGRAGRAGGSGHSAHAASWD